MVINQIINKSFMGDPSCAIHFYRGKCDYVKFVFLWVTWLMWLSGDYSVMIMIGIHKWVILQYDDGEK